MQCNDGRMYQSFDEGYTDPRYRQSGQRSISWVTWMLVAANVLAFLYLEWKGSTEDSYFMIEHGTLMPMLVIEWKEYYRLFTSFFMHYGLRHLVMNMLLLWYLGSRLEKYLGHIKFGILYLLCGLGGNVVSLIVYQLTDPYVSSAGASGAVFGVVGAMLWVVLRHRGQLADVTTRQLGLMIFFTLYNGFADSGINNAAHVGGVILGFLLGMLFYRGGQRIRSWKRKDPEDMWYDLS